MLKVYQSKIVILQVKSWCLADYLILGTLVPVEIHRPCSYYRPSKGGNKESSSTSLLADRSLAISTETAPLVIENCPSFL